MALECKCGAGIAQDSDAVLCLYCQSKLTHCRIDAYQFVAEGFDIPVPWCMKKDCRILHADCNNCENYTDTKILPEVE